MKVSVFILLIFCSVSAGAQTTVNYSFDITDQGIFLVERVEKVIAGSPRKQVLETPMMFRDTSEVSGYLSALRTEKAQSDARLRAETTENSFLRSKINVLTGLTDSLFFKPKTVAKQ